MMYAGRFKFLKIFHHHDFEKLLSKAVEVLKFGLVKGLLQAGNFQNVFLGSNMSVKHLKMVLG